MSTVAERHTKGQDTACTASRPLSWCAPGVLSYCLVLQVCDCRISTHVLISHDLLDAVGVRPRIPGRSGTDLGADTVGDFTLNSVAHV